MSFTNMTEEQRQQLINKGFTLKEIQAAQYTELYRKAYNAKPEVKLKRRVYNQNRYNRFKAMKELL